MGFMINQGKQDVSQDKDFEIIISEREVGRIRKISEHKFFDDAMNVEIEIISEGPYKGRVVFDGVTYDPSSEHSWKYRQLRKFAGVPYSENESPNIDIEALLVGKVIAMELTQREDKNEPGTFYQQVKYKKFTNADASRINTGTTGNTPVQPTPVQPAQGSSIMGGAFNSAPQAQPEAQPQSQPVNNGPIDVTEDDLPF